MQTTSGTISTHTTSGAVYILLFSIKILLKKPYDHLNQTEN